MAHILAIDDDEAMLALIKNALKKDGHEVTCISRIADSLINRLSSYDLILLDVMMPDVDGYTFFGKSAVSRTARFFFSPRRVLRRMWTSVFPWARTIISKSPFPFWSCAPVSTPI